MAGEQVVNLEALKVDPVWKAIREEAEGIISSEPLMSSFIYSNILHHKTLEDAVIHRISERLHNRDFSADLVRQNFTEMANDNPEWSEVLRIDISAVYERDPACSRLIEPILYFKGFQALQTHRLAHWNLNRGHKDIAKLLIAAGANVNAMNEGQGEGGNAACSAWATSAANPPRTTWSGPLRPIRNISWRSKRSTKWAR